ncbi:transcriptional regulator [Corynebacterium sp.]|uniref:transcriptional regulator n=1 Tax=Corynebacterium sp. TaxID=1720 RepID=UPI0026DC848D|nr:transcriptional regulator [Corynebacterium sp.]MDO5032844.1 transcriptional regulator [Corynebacterium sp.]
MPALHPLLIPLEGFKLCATLDAFAATQGEINREMKSTELAKHAELTQQEFGRHLAALEEAGFISSFREYGSKQDTVWLSLTAAGQRALAAHVAALEQIAAGA